MADQYSNVGSSTGNVSGESSDLTVQLNIKTLDSQIYSFQVDKNVRANLPDNCCILLYAWGYL